MNVTRRANRPLQRLGWRGTFLLRETIMNTTTHRAPSYRIYAVERRHPRKVCWMDIGTAFTHRDGKGFDLELQTMPLSAAQLVARISAEKRLADGSIVRFTGQKRRCSRKTNSVLKTDSILSACL